MKHSIIPGLCCLLSFAFGACERHSWQETKKLQEHGHGAEAAAHAEARGSKASDRATEPNFDTFGPERRVSPGSFRIPRNTQVARNQ